MNKLVSVIVPLYNSERTLERTVKSILNQNFSNIEVLLIDDGSTDESPYICDRLSKEYKQIRTVHITNGGAGRAKNIGISKAVGDYILIVDSDDFVDRKLIELCVETSEKENSDLIIFRFDYYTQSGERMLVDTSSLNSKKVLSPGMALRLLFTNKFGPIGRNLFISKQLSRKIIFPERTHEDGATIYKLIGDSNKVVYIPERLYKYIQYSNSMVHSFHLNDFDNLLLNNQEVENYVLHNFPKLYAICLDYCSKVAIDGLKDIYMHKKRFPRKYIQIILIR